MAVSFDSGTELKVGPGENPGPNTDGPLAEDGLDLEDRTGPSSSIWNRSTVITTLVIALLAYLPTFRIHPGKLSADTKSYLYINPSGLMHQALYMWDSFVGNGTVTHQFIGYLFPMGPYYWLVKTLGVPMWVGQRFWLGSIFFFAGTGILYMGRKFGLKNWALMAPAVGYMLSPYVLSYAARLSALLLPFSAAGWLVGVMLVTLRKPGWRYPAIFSLILAVTSTVNATSAIYVIFAPGVFRAQGLQSAIFDIWRLLRSRSGQQALTKQ